MNAPDLNLSDLVKHWDRPPLPSTNTDSTSKLIDSSEQKGAQTSPAPEQPDPADSVIWTAIKADYEAGEYLSSIASRYSQTKPSITARAKAEGWKKGTKTYPNKDLAKIIVGESKRRPNLDLPYSQELGRESGDSLSASRSSAIAREVETIDQMALHALQTKRQGEIEDGLVSCADLLRKASKIKDVSEAASAVQRISAAYQRLADAQRKWHGLDKAGSGEKGYEDRLADFLAATEGNGP